MHSFLNQRKFFIINTEGQVKQMKTSSELASKKNISFTKYSDKFKDIFQKSHSAIIQPQACIEEISPAIINNYFFYRVKSLGVGAHSFVYLVQEEETKCLYAEKAIIKSHALEHWPQLMNQIKILLHISHPNIIKLFHVFTDESYLNLILQFAEDSLFHLKEKFNIFKEKEVIEILKQLLSGLDHLHSRHIVHADIKLQNIMIANGTVKLCDFGYAHINHQSQSESEQHFYSKIDKVNKNDEANECKRNQQLLQNTQKMAKQSKIVGTLEYLSPEYAQGHDSGWRRDIWAVGILAFEMAVGKNPFQEMKENQKWAKLIHNSSQDYLQQMIKIAQEKGVRSQKIQEIVSHMLCPSQERWKASQILALPHFL